MTKTEQQYIEDWKKLGYTDEQSEELARLSKLGSGSGVDAHVADRILNDTLKRYDKEKCITK